MKKITIFYVYFLLLVLMPSLACAEEERRGSLPATQVVQQPEELKVGVPLAAGDIVVRGQLEDELDAQGQGREVYRQFLGMTPEGLYSVQSFFNSDGIKLTNPYTVISLGAVFDKRFGGHEREVQGDYVQWYHNGLEHARYYYQNGKLMGLQSSWYENGRKMLEVSFIDGVAQGQATIWDSDGFKVSEVIYRENQVKEIKNYAYGQFLIAHYVMDENGEGGSHVNFWFRNGQKESEGALQNDLKQGPWTSWYENGHMRSQGTYHHDEKVGSWKYWDENGILTPSEAPKP